jgi:hypothetical protein
VFGGELATGWTLLWLTATREQIRRELLDACATLAAADPEGALYWLQRVVTADPYNEALHQQIADLLDASGGHPAARRLITTFHQRLADGDTDKRREQRS